MTSRKWLRFYYLKGQTEMRKLSTLEIIIASFYKVCGKYYISVQQTMRRDSSKHEIIFTCIGVISYNLKVFLFLFLSLSYAHACVCTHERARAHTHTHALTLSYTHTNIYTRKEKVVFIVTSPLNALKFNLTNTV